MPLGPGALYVAAEALAKLCRLGFGSRGDFAATNGCTADALGISAEDARAVIAQARAIAESRHDEAALLQQLQRRLVAARLEYPRAACPCCGRLGQLKVERPYVAAILTACVGAAGRSGTWAFYVAGTDDAWLWAWLLSTGRSTCRPRLHCMLAVGTGGWSSTCPRLHLIIACRGGRCSWGRWRAVADGPHPADCTPPQAAPARHVLGLAVR